MNFIQWYILEKDSFIIINSRFQDPTSPPPLIPRKFSDFSLIINIQTTLTALFSLNDFFILSQSGMIHSRDNLKTTYPDIRSQYSTTGIYNLQPWMVGFQQIISNPDVPPHFMENQNIDSLMLMLHTFYLPYKQVCLDCSAQKAFEPGPNVFRVKFVET